MKSVFKILKTGEGETRIYYPCKLSLIYEKNKYIFRCLRILMLCLPCSGGGGNVF